MYHHTCIIIHPSICLTTPQLPTQSTNTTPDNTHTIINYIFGMMTSYSLRPQVVVSAGEDGPCVCDCEDGLIHTPVSSAIISIPPTPLVLGYDIIIMSSCYSSSAPCIIIHVIHPFICLTTPQLTTQSTHTTPHTHNNQLYLWGDDKLLSQASGCCLSR